MGRYAVKFEMAFAEFCGVEHAVSCCNGTAALHLALLAADIKPGERVLVPALSYIATANAVRYCGAEPVFCDVDRNTWTLDVRDAEEKIKQAEMEGHHVTAVIPVHLYGVPVNNDALTRLAVQYGLAVIEDAAQSHGAMWKNRRTGNLGMMGAFSFYGNKLLTCGEGGMVTTNDDQLAAYARVFRGQGMSLTRRYWHDVVGYNYRITEMQAAIGFAQLETYAQHAAAHSNVAKRYRKNLKNAFITQSVPTQALSAHWMFSIICSTPTAQVLIARGLAEVGIETRPFFIPLNELPPYLTPTYDCPNTKWLAERGLNLPTHAGLTDDDVDYVCEHLLRVAKEVASCRVN
jgi:perosamine synthetase